MALNQKASSPLLFSALGLFFNVASAESSKDEFDRWVDVEHAAQQVNEGALSFLIMEENHDVHHHENQVRISGDSLDTGWVKLIQCHTRLQQVPRLQKPSGKTLSGKSKSRAAHTSTKPGWGIIPFYCGTSKKTPVSA